jgi:hypothetical protein
MERINGINGVCNEPLGGLECPQVVIACDLYGINGLTTPSSSAASVERIIFCAGLQPPLL